MTCALCRSPPKRYRREIGNSVVPLILGATAALIPNSMTLPTQLAYLCHMRDALAAVREYTAGGRDAFFASPMIQDAVLRNLEVLGEAVKGLDR